MRATVTTSASTGRVDASTGRVDSNAWLCITQKVYVSCLTNQLIKQSITASHHTLHTHIYTQTIPVTFANHEQELEIIKGTLEPLDIFSE